MILIKDMALSTLRILRPLANLLILHIAVVGFMVCGYTGIQMTMIMCSGMIRITIVRTMAPID